MSEAYSVTFYWPGVSTVAKDGTLTMRVTGDDGGWRWSGERRIEPNDPDYPMWRRYAEAFRTNPPAIPFISSEQLPALRSEFKRENPVRE